MKALFDASLCSQFVLTLGHFLWQGLAIGGLAVLAGRALRYASAPLRYRVYLSALVVMAACPVLTFLWLGSAAVPLSGDQLAPAAIKSQAWPESPMTANATPSESAVPIVPAADRFVGRGSGAGTETAAAMDDKLASERPPAATVEQSDWQRFAPGLMALYLTGVLAMFLRLTLGLWGGRRLRRRSEAVADPDLLDLLARRAAALRLRTVPALAWCREIAVPTVVGVVRPAILLPMTLATGLTTDQLAAILTHELAHIRRWDPLVNIVQRVVEAVLFFHPMVWLISRRIGQEREHCCDDLVLAMGTDPVGYASSLLDIAQRATDKRSLPALAVLRADGETSELGGRIRRMLGANPHETMRLSRPGLALVAVMMLLMLAGLGRLAITGEQEAPQIGEQETNKETNSSPRITLPNGTVVELVGVAVNPWEDERWWRPDGKQLTEIPELHGRSRVPVGEESFARTFVFRAWNLPDRATYQTEVTPKQAGGASGAQRAGRSAPLQVYATQSIPKNAKTATVRFSFTADDWETVLTLDPAGKPLGKPAPLGRAIQFNRLAAVDDGLKVVLRAPKKVGNQTVEYRIRIIDQAGAEHPEFIKSTSQGGNSPTKQLTHNFLVAPDQIREIRVQAVPYRYSVTFRNVALQPGQHTDLETEIEVPQQISRQEFSGFITSRVIRWLPFESDKHRQQTAAEFRELVRKYAPEQPAMEFAQGILKSLDWHVKHEFPEGPNVADPDIRDRYHIKLPRAIRMLQWRLFMALRRRPLDVQQQARLAEQHKWLREHIRSLPNPPAKYQHAEFSHASALERLQEKIEDPLCPLFQEPLSDEQFAEFQQKLREQTGKSGDRALIYAVHVVVQTWLEARYDVRQPGPIFPAPQLKTFDERDNGYSLANGYLHVIFPSAEVFRGKGCALTDYRRRGSTIANLSEARPSELSLKVIADVSGQKVTLKELDRRLSEKEGRGHIIFEEQQMRLIGMRGTRLVSIPQRHFFEADRIPTQQLREQVEKKGSRFWKLPAPVSRDEEVGESDYEAMAAALTSEGQLFILQVREHGPAGLQFHIRLHHPRSEGEEQGEIE